MTACGVKTNVFESELEKGSYDSISDLVFADNMTADQVHINGKEQSAKGLLSKHVKSETS